MSRHFARRDYVALPRNVFRLENGDALVAGRPGQGPLSLRDWRAANPSPRSTPDPMINVAGFPMESKEYERTRVSLLCLGDDNLATLHKIIEAACETVDPREFIRKALSQDGPQDSHARLRTALETEKLLGRGGFLKPQAENFLLNEKFPEFFEQKPAPRTSAEVRFTSRAAEIFSAVNAGRTNLVAAECTPWAVLANADLIGPREKRSSVSLVAQYV